MCLHWLPWCGTSTADMGLGRVPGRDPVSCAFLQLGSPQLHQGAGTSSPLMGMGTAPSSSSGAAMLARASADSFGGTELPLFSLLKQVTAFARSVHCHQQLF